MLELLGLPPDTDAQGVSIAPALLAGMPFARACAFHEQRGWVPRDGIYGVGVRRGGCKRLRYPDQRGWVLVDLKIDPDEYDNRWNDPTPAAMQAELKDDLLHWLADTPPATARHGRESGERLGQAGCAPSSAVLAPARAKADDLPRLLRPVRRGRALTGHDQVTGQWPGFESIL
jgi:hypothetical protein